MNIQEEVSKWEARRLELENRMAALVSEQHQIGEESADNDKAIVDAFFALYDAIPKPIQNKIRHRINTTTTK